MADNLDVSQLWKVITEQLEELDLDGFKLSYNDQKASRFIQLYPRYVLNGNGWIHYEIQLRATGVLDVALHFEFPSGEASVSYLNLLRPHAEQIGAGLPHPFTVERHAAKSAQACFAVPVQLGDLQATAREAVRVMDLLIQRTWPVLEPHLPKDRSVV